MTAITIAKGEDEVLNFTITNESTGNAVNITGATITLLVYGADRSTPVIEKECEILVAGSGTCKATLTDTDTNIPIGFYDYELRLVDAGSQKIQVRKTSEFNVLQGSAP